MLELQVAIGHVVEVIGRWESQPNVPLNQETDECVESLAKVLDRDDFERDEWHTVLAADEFVEAYVDVGRRLQDSRAVESLQYGDGKLWSAYRKMLNSRQPRRYPPLESLCGLEKMGVGYNQMAIMGGWYKPDGEPDIPRVTQELMDERANGYKGKHKTPKEIEETAQVEKDWADRQRVRDRERAEAAATEEPPPARETLDELVLLPNMSRRQIKIMKPEVTDAEIDSCCQIHGVTLSEESPHYTAKANIAERAQHAEEAIRRDQQHRAEVQDMDGHDEIESVAERILAMHDDGHRPKTIAAKLDEQGVSMRPQEVGRVIRKRERELREAEEDRLKTESV